MEQKPNNTLKVSNIFLILIQGPANPKYKTSLCKHYNTTQGCSYGDKCQFAHGPEELRLNSGQPMSFMNPMNMNQNMDKIQNNLLNYKIAKCRNWEKDKSCKYGDKCTFAHGDAELRIKTDNLTYMNQPFPFMPVMIDQSGNPIMMPPGNFTQMPMMGGAMNPNPFFMGMMPPNANIPPAYNNNENQNDNNGGNDKNQQ